MKVFLLNNGKLSDKIGGADAGKSDDVDDVEPTRLAYNFINAGESEQLAEQVADKMD